MRRKTLALSSAITLLVAPGITVQTFAQHPQLSSASKTAPKAQTNILDQYGKLPLSFEANHGQTDSKVKFLSRGHGYSLFLTGSEAVIVLKKTAPKTEEMKVLSGRELVKKRGGGAEEGTIVRMELAGANAAPRVAGAEELPGKTNYFIGNDPAKWRTNVPTYSKVQYEGVYPGVDLVYYGNQGRLEYDFVVAPGVDPNEIRLKFYGAGKLRLDKKGDLLLGAEGEEVRFEKPLVYQELAGEQKTVESSYVLASTNRIGFQLGEYDHSQPLVIDPVLSYSTYLGGSASDSGQGIAVDGSGNAYVTGSTSSANFPAASALQSTLAGTVNAFVTKINASGSALVYSTYLGGGNQDFSYGIAVDGSGNAYVTGSTSSTNFPTANALQSTIRGSTNAFVTEINAGASALVYSTYLGGNASDAGRGIAVDASGNAYVTGDTTSSNFPTADALQPTLAGSENAFVTKLNPSGSALVYSTYLGGNSVDQGFGIALDTMGDAYVTGLTYSPNFPTANALQPKGGVSEDYDDAFVTKLNPSGSAFVYSTYLGGHTFDGGMGIAVDTSGNAYVTGYTSSVDFPTTPDALQSILSNPTNAAYSLNSFVTELNPIGSALVYSTYFGVSQGQGIAVDASGNVYFTGSAGSIPTANALQSTNAGSQNAFVAKIASIQDTTPPATTAMPSLGPNSYGWNNTSVTVALSAIDNPGGSGVKQIQFSLSGAENVGLQTLAGNAASVTVSAAGITTLTYFATDNAGNVETPKTLTVQIDLTAPVVTVTHVSNGAVYYYGQTPSAGCSTSDALSGVATPASLAVTGGNKSGYGNYTATCSGAMDKAGNAAAPISVSYTVNGPASLAGLVEQKTGPLNSRVWRIFLSNSGPGTAYNAEITNLSLRQASGAACAPHLESTLPVTAGNIRPFSAATLSVTIDFAGCAPNARFVLNGQVSANDATAVGKIVMLTELP
ncbi:MAG TPA: SBBP repeat-containing protein [Verrucomicrobiae bacterium]|nr:SBBP repeat-containing protein [Verrucomicrobiae bacterium]